MADTYTEKIELTIIDPESKADIRVINSNMQKIDDYIKNLEESIKSGDLLPDASGVAF